MEKLRLIFLVSLLCGGGIMSLHAQEQIYVAVDGNDSNTGTISSPLQTLIGARDKVRSIISSSGLPDGGVIVNFRGGIYPLTQTCEMNSLDAGEIDKPIVYTGYEDEKVIFDGSLFVDNSKFELCNSTHDSKLHNDAIGNVYYQVLDDEKIISLLQSDDAQMSINGRMMSIARYPNLGFATVNQSTIINETDSQNEEGTFDSPKGVKFKLTLPNDFSKWQDEIDRTHRVLGKGFYSAQWLRETISLANVSQDYLQLKDGTVYGFYHLVENGRLNRIFFNHLLCELDESGEWYFDKTDNTLYVWLNDGEKENTRIGLLAGPMMVNLQGAKYVNFLNMTIQNLGKGVNGDAAINMKTGSDYLIAGVTFRNLTSPLTAFNTVEVTNSTVLSCNFIDNFGNSRLLGGSFNSKGIVSVGNNRIENCHFTRMYATEFDGKATHIAGVGNIFKNNLVHNILSEPITHFGIDHQIYNNEIFNVGIEEGDDGGISTGGDVMSYGNVIKHNFIHHVMDVPTLFGRSGIMCDDYDGGEFINQNILYKGGGDGAIKMNRGAGHTITENVMLDCGMGVMHSDGGPVNYALAMEFINSTNNKLPTDDIKTNYMGRMLQKIGIPNWEVNINETNWVERIEPYWTERYPIFLASMQAYADNDEMNAFECRLYDNMFWSNGKGNIRGGSSEILRNNYIDLSVFEDPEVLNFKFSSPRPSYAPDIPFENIGLYLDSYRTVVPDKDTYRRAIKERFDGQDCYGGTYDPETINERLYYNSGAVVLGLMDDAEDVSINAEIGLISTAIEGDSSKLELSMILSKTNTTGRAITFAIDDLNTGTAISGEDYVAVPDDAKISIPNGANFGLFSIQLIDDDNLEYDETINLNVSNANYAYVIVSQADLTVNIIDNDSYVANILPLKNGSEDSPTAAKFSVFLNRVNQSGVSIHVPIEDALEGTAHSGLDYHSVEDLESIEIVNGSICGQYSLPLVDDSNLEDIESVTLKIKPHANVLILDSLANATIADEDFVTAELSASEALENDSVGLVFKVTLSQVNETNDDVTFKFTDFEDGDAFIGIDYVELPWFAQIVVPVGSSTGEYTVSIIGDNRTEDRESINVKIGECSNDRVFVTTALATGYILDENSNSLAEVNNESLLQLFPNPVRNILMFNIPVSLSMPKEVQIINSLTNSEVSYTPFQNEIDVTTLSPGLYFARIYSDNQVITKKFIKL